MLATRNALLNACILILILLSSCPDVFAQQEGTESTEISDDNWHEIAIVVHGITPNRTSPDEDPSYQRFRENLKQAFYRMRLNHQFDFMLGDENVIYIYYGSKRAQRFSGDNISNNLEMLQQIIGEFDARAWQKTEDRPDSLLRQTAFKNIREVMLYGISDAFYYNSRHGGNAIRGVILKQIYQGLKKNGVLNDQGIIPEPGKISFTIYSHSLGAIVMYDLLELIFSENEESIAEFVDDPVALQALEGFLKLKQANRVRVRKFFSMGTQIPVMYLKYEDSMQTMLVGELKNIEHIFPSGEGVADPRWINLWDKDDILGYPLAYLFNNRSETDEKIVFDVAVDAGDYLPHIAYWWSKDVAEVILRYFYGLSEDDIREYE
jgi:hypothetical protein